MDYQEALDYISSLAQRGWRLGLDRMEEFAKRADLMNSGAKYIHVAGTNGKGSTTAMLQSCLVECGFRTGAFFSPYVVDPRERVQFNRELISESDLAEITSHLKPIGETLSETEFGGVTEFEFKTAIGFEYWKRKNCEWVALEVGLGGRLDATNIITPQVAVIVSIGYDHMSILGDTLSEIAFEKAGIIKEGVPVVVGSMPIEALARIEEVALENDAPIWRMEREIKMQPTSRGVLVSTPGQTIELCPSLFGKIQHHNAALVFAALELAGLAKEPEPVKNGVSSAYLPGRFTKFSIYGKTVILDGAHNGESSIALAEMLDELEVRSAICVTGMLSGHSAKEFYEPLRKYVKEFYVTPIDFHRSRDAQELSAEISENSFTATTFENTRAALQAALGQNEFETVLVTGSFYLVGEAMRQILR